MNIRDSKILLQNSVKTANKVVFSEKKCWIRAKFFAEQLNGFIHSFDYTLVIHVNIFYKATSPKVFRIKEVSEKNLGKAQ